MNGIEIKGEMAVLKRELETIKKGSPAGKKNGLLWI